jgi:hypothetical protein
MIRSAILHLVNEQPLLVDLFAMPSPQDAALVCTNLRTTNGRRAPFAEATDSVFVFPLGHVRFLEVLAGSRPDGAVAESDGSAAPAEPEPDGELEVDEELLRRVREL